MVRGVADRREHRRAGISLLVLRILGHLGGFILLPLNTHLAHVSALANNFRLTGEGLLWLYGANFVNMPPGPQTALALLHLAGLALAAWALVRALRRFFRGDDLVVQVLALGILADVAAFAFSSLPFSLWDTRQVSVALPFGAVLAGRLLAGDLLRLKLAPALAVVLACYAAALGFDVAQPSVPAYDQPLAGWLVEHGFSYGLSNYYTGNITTLDSGGRVHLVAVSWGADKSVPRAYQSDSSWYDPRLHYANFVVNNSADRPLAIIPSGDLVKAFGAGQDLSRWAVHDHGVEQEPAGRPRPGQGRTRQCRAVETGPRAHWVFAAAYDPVSRSLERSVLGEQRARLLAGVTGQVLDVGAGTGANLPYLRQASRVVAAEPDLAMRRRLAARLARASVPVELSSDSAEQLRYADASFDAVVFTLVLCSVARPDRALAEARRVLRRGPAVRPGARPRRGVAGELAGPADPAVVAAERRLPARPGHRRGRRARRIHLRAG